MTMASFGAFVRGFLVAILYNVPIDVCSAAYVVALDVSGLDSYKAFWLRVAKYNGFALSMALVFLYVATCTSLKTILARLAFIVRTRRLFLQRCGDRLAPLCRGSLMRAHVLYALRFLFSSLVHTLVHVFITHPFPALVSSVSSPSSMIMLCWFHYRWTISGYALVVLLLLLFATGFRLVRFASHHVSVRMAHSAFHLLSLMFVTVHSSNYAMLSFLWGIVLSELLCFIALVRVVPVESLVVYRDDVDSREVVLDIEFINPPFFASLYRTGDVVRVYVPMVSWFEWHTFSLVPHLHDRTRSRLLIRTVGRWTRRLYRVRKRVAYLWLHGPLELHDDIESMLVVPESDVPICIDPGLQMCLVCSGISITRHLALLVYLVRKYCGILVDGIHSGPANIGLPAFIKLVWVVRYSFDINLAIRVLDELQACLRAHGWQSLLIYDIYVSNEPNLDERAVNTRLRSFLAPNDTSCRPYIVPPRPNTNVFIDFVDVKTRSRASLRGFRPAASIYKSSYANDIESLLGTPPPVEQPPVVAASPRSRRRPDSMRMVERAGSFARFYSALELKTGQRVRSWLPIVRVEQRTTDRLQWQTLIVLTTGVKRIVDDLVRLCSNSEHGLELCVEELW